MTRVCGVQAEQRSFWDAPDTYAAMAPFNNANKIATPLLLIHGEADNNTGSPPRAGLSAKLVLWV